MNQKERMQELAVLLRQASQAYYQEDCELMSNYEYDKLYDELLKLEQETQLVLAGSPTHAVGYEAKTELPKEAHEITMLSLDKTKDQATLRSFIGTHKVLLSWKLDGLTIVLHYRDGQLSKAVTRGNGAIGEVITNNAKVFRNIPLRIPYQQELTLRGEAIITYSDFEQINRQLPETDARYKNPRNLCSGSVRQLNNEVTAARKVQFFAFSLVSAKTVEFDNSRENQMKWIKEQGFDVVEYRITTAATLDEELRYFSEQIDKTEFPSDGLVAIYDDIAYGESLGTTTKFPRNSLAFKWEDETRETVLRAIEWSPSRTGLINPVAIFDPVELEGTTVSRASVHNISIMKALQLGIGDVIRVYKANMIIPQVAENLTRSSNMDIPEHCPVCQGAARIKKANDVESLYCTNDDCPAKAIKAFTHFVSRDGMNIEGMSEATLEKFIARGFITEFADVFELARHKNAIVELEGFGEKSYAKLEASLAKAQNTSLPRLIYALGITNIGLANARMICRQYDYDLAKIRHASAEALQLIDGIGGVIAQRFADFFKTAENNQKLDRLLAHLTIAQEAVSEQVQDLTGMNFVVTGTVERFANRNAVKELIESRGGKVTGSVTSKTNYLINNEPTSPSSKNKKAKELEIPIISETEFIEMMGLSKV